MGRARHIVAGYRATDYLPIKRQPMPAIGFRGRFLPAEGTSP